MNLAEQRRNIRIAALSDLDLLDEILNSTDLDIKEHIAFTNMRSQLRTQRHAQLSRKQREWAEEAARRCVPIDAKDVPRGRTVVTPVVLQNLPKRPPGR